MTQGSTAHKRIGDCGDNRTRHQLFNLYRGPSQPRLRGDYDRTALGRMVHAVVHRRSKARGPHQLRWKDFGPGRVSLEDGGPVLEAKKDRKFAFQ